MRHRSEDNTFDGDFGQECIIFVYVYTYIYFYIVENTFISCSVPPPFIYSKSKKLKDVNSRHTSCLLFLSLSPLFSFFLLDKENIHELSHAFWILLVTGLC